MFQVERVGSRYLSALERYQAGRRYGPGSSEVWSRIAAKSGSCYSIESDATSYRPKAKS